MSTSLPHAAGHGPILFGGPPAPRGVLRDALFDLVEAAPPSARIDWATYYFRDTALAAALIRAADRGVAVRLVMDAAPRRAEANAQVVAMLSAHGLRGGFVLRRRALSPGHLHSKIYAFSDPALALVGSFNPSGDAAADAADPAVVQEIGDQDAGYNLLYAIIQPSLVAALGRYVGRIAGGTAGLGRRLSPAQNRIVQGTDEALYFYPRLSPGVVERDLAEAGRGWRIRAAISHLKRGGLLDGMMAASRRGADVALLAHATERRVPERAVRALAEAGIATHRVGDGHVLPMHDKYILVEPPAAMPHAWIGSLNYNPKSRWLNDELLVRTTHPRALAQLHERFDAVRATARA
ncbi:phospholipase D-like domain-containing protein [Sphingomonas jatrophae]|uniref:Phospholipase D n=1 Tax=Sphingomonas jatrophae TaxID=1166337 RepID=A0A1I6K1E2_9SPHN|nr:phospholipase D-like domain-containing protein [Sphingomonas jatrophae]SFR84918.1 Phosphatidylserine/phosphatidylglycerophosphate/cardiolipin synthase [Sphingomonas jatrophae]